MPTVDVEPTDTSRDEICSTFQHFIYGYDAFRQADEKIDEEKEEQRASHTHMTDSRLDCCFLSSDQRRCHQNVHLCV